MRPMEGLRIVRGNDFHLEVPVRKIVFTTDESGDPVRVEQRIELSDCSVIQVSLVDANECKIPLAFAVTEEDDSKLLVKVDAKYQHCGWCGLEVLGTLNGRRWRSYERKVFKIVENNGKSYVDGALYKGERSYQVDTMWVLYANTTYPNLHLDLDHMTLNQVGTVENGETYIDDSGHLCLRVTK